jgi:hypothetical protein
MQLISNFGTVVRGAASSCAVRSTNIQRRWLADGKILWRSLAKANAAKRSKTKKDTEVKIAPYRGQGRRTPGVRRTRTAHGKTRPKQSW